MADATMKPNRDGKNRCPVSSRRAGRGGVLAHGISARLIEWETMMTADLASAPLFLALAQSCYNG
jgi:hypothetical protein